MRLTLGAVPASLREGVPALLRRGMEDLPRLLHFQRFETNLGEF